MTRILVIEDEEAIRDDILDLLEAEGFETTAAENGAVGVTTARLKLPDLIICDITMPVLDGYGVLEELRKTPETQLIPFIFLTAMVDKDHLRQGMNLGADDYLTKPVDSDELLRAIQTRLNKQAAISEANQKQFKELLGKLSDSLPEEFVEPLSVIMMSSEILIKHADTMKAGQLEELGQNINRTATRLNRMIQNRLLISKLELLAKEPAKVNLLRNLQINEVTMAAVNGRFTTMLKEKARQHHRMTDLDLQLNPAAVHISEEHLKRIAEELVENAFKFSRAGSAITVVSGYNQRRDRYIFAVYNYGKEFDREISTKFSGGGIFKDSDDAKCLGLTVVKRILELYNGDLIIDYLSGRQTVVAARLPL